MLLNAGFLRLKMKSWKVVLTNGGSILFDIDEERMGIDVFVNNIRVDSYEIQKSNIKSFEPSYFDNYGAVTTTYAFASNDGKTVTIKEDFGKSEKEILNAFMAYMYLPKSMMRHLEKC